MTAMVKHSLHTKTSTFSNFNRFSKFVLLGNNIDGYVNFRKEVFRDFDEVMERLPKIFSELRYEGEWDIHLYQVPDDFRISYIYGGYYQKPSKGRRVFCFSYMEAGEDIAVTVTPHLIHLFAKTVRHDEVWEKNRNRYEHSITEESLTILLKEELNGTEFPNDAYPGSYDTLVENLVKA